MSVAGGLAALGVAASLALAATGAAAAEAKIVNAQSFYPEGPLWHAGKLYYVERTAQTVMTWDGKENRQIWRQEGCGPSGLVETAGGDLLVACYDANTIVRIDGNGQTLDTIPADGEGQPFLGPNDFARDAKGGIYVSASGAFDTAAAIRGRIYYIAPDGQIRAVAYLLHYPDGLALTDGGRTLLAAEHLAGRVLKFEVTDDGSLGNRKVFRRLQDIAPPPANADAYVGPGGLEVDAQGNVYICQYGAGRVLVTDRDGRLLRMIGVPDAYVTNLSFGADPAALYVTAVSDARIAPYPGAVYEAANR
jgi:sugar lactone lactonase YvrE